MAQQHETLTLAEWEQKVGREADVFVLVEFAMEYGVDADDAMSYATFGNVDGLRRRVEALERGEFAA